MSRKTVTIIWRIENFSYCSQKKGQFLRSPSFFLEELDQTEWFLGVYPRGMIDSHYIEIAFGRSEDGVPDSSVVVFELSLLTCDDSFEESRYVADTFVENESRCLTFITRNEMFCERRSSFLPQDTLTVKCCVWKFDGDIPHDVLYCARTMIERRSRSFEWAIQKFSALNDTVEKNIPHTKRVPFQNLARLRLSFKEELQLDRRIALEIRETLAAPTTCFATFKVCLLDASGRAEDLCRDEHFFDAQMGPHVWQLPLLITKGQLVQKSHLYLPDDVLTLRCEYVVSDGTTYQSQEKVFYGSQSRKYLQQLLGELKRRPEVESSADGDRSLRDYLQRLHDDRQFCDFSLVVGTEAYPVHKDVLRAWSPVFRTMLAADMRESITNSVNIPDVDSDIVRRLLLFLYTGALEDLTCDSASALFFLADKYEITCLKQRCSRYLEANLCISNACDILVLADMHLDDRLKEAATDFVLCHKAEVLVSGEWSNLMKQRTELATEILGRIFAQ